MSEEEDTGETPSTTAYSEAGLKEKQDTGCEIKGKMLFFSCI